ncbi:MAG: nuclear transport factor 2 family protein [Burkholderiaceae bacterium]|jgi:ketosteroid isomerase-like protein|nr:nuclear transport factor 2 family protein [Burkholderiaceae bacterium]MEB2319906.1 nuclear transport factor 2 family protein [Pseudomonadota bacterium]
MTTTRSETDRDAQVRILTELNRNYVRSIDEADTVWFEEHLADDFMNMNPDGALLDRTQFITQVSRGSSVRQLREQHVGIRLLGDFAFIHARTTFIKPDGQPGSGCYTDVWRWQEQEGRWACVSAHVNRL